MRTLIFNSAEDAYLVAEQLYDCEVKDNCITFNSIGDTAAINLAINLANVDLVVEGEKCILPFHSKERECNEDVLKIYVACLASYNNGYLHGMFIDATQEPEDIQDDIDWMLSWSPVQDEGIYPEEWAIHDYEGFESFSLREHENLKYISQLAQVLENADDAEAMAAWLEYAKEHISNPDIEELAEEFNSHYCGKWDCERDFVLKSSEVEDVFNWEEFEKKFKFWSYHIDWNSVARDLFLEGYHSVPANPYGIHVFRDYYN